MKYIQILIFFFLSSFGNTIFAQTNLTSKDTSEVRFINARKFYIYKVDKGETLFSISQKFNIPQQEIIEFNKNINKQGLKYKSKIWIPAFSWLNKEAHNEIIIEEEYDKHPEKNVYKIAIVGLLNLPKFYSLDSTVEDSSIIEDNMERDIVNNLTFVEGAIYSAEQLTKEGFKSHLFILDSEQDTVKLSSKLRQELPDLIISNESGSTLKYLSHYAEIKNIKLISCGINTTECIKESNNSYSLYPSSLTQCERMGFFNSKYFPGAVAITIHSKQAKENDRAASFRSGWKSGGGGRNIIVDYTKGGAKAILDSLSSSKKNIIFLSFSNEDIITTILAGLKNQTPEKNITVAGLPTWQYFETIDQKLLDKCNAIIFSSGFIDYKSTEVENFRKYFREKYNSEPTEASFQGVDAMKYIAKNFLKFGKKFITNSKSIYVDGLFSEYDMEENENKTIHVFQPTKDEDVNLFLKIKKK